jgi:predicted dehydrogenase
MELIAAAGLAPLSDFSGALSYDDRRALIFQSGIEALVLGVSTRKAVELTQLAIERGVHVWRMPPAARSFAETAEWCANRLDDAAERPAVERVASWWDHVADAAPAAANHPAPAYTEIDVRAPAPPPRSWREDREAAGGGVVIGDAYHAIETLVALRGLPDSLTAALLRRRRHDDQPPAETEDCCVATLRYRGGSIASLRAVMGPPPFRATYTQIDHDTVTITPLPPIVAINDEEADDEARTGASEDDFVRMDLRRFAADVRAARDGAAAWIEREAAVRARHRLTHAVIEAIYLAARTGQPESPAKLIEVE